MEWKLLKDARMGSSFHEEKFPLRRFEHAELHCLRSHGRHLLLKVFLRDFEDDRPATDHDVTLQILPNLRITHQDDLEDFGICAKQLVSIDFGGLEESLRKLGCLAFSIIKRVLIVILFSSDSLMLHHLPGLSLSSFKDPLYLSQ